MKEREETRLPQDKDPHLDIPAEANTQEHINFLEAEENTSAQDRKNEETEERQKQWQQGIEEGNKERNA